MSIKCLCDKYHKIRICGTSKIRATTAGVRSLTPRVCGEGSLRPANGITLGAKTRICSSSKIRAFANSEMVPSKFPCEKAGKIKATTQIPELHIRSILKSNSKFKNSYVDKFAGQFASLRKIKNFVAQQKLYPSGDISNVGFVNENIQGSNIFSSIDEGVFTGNYTQHGSISERIDDINSTYIQPSSIATEGSFFYECAVNPALIKTKNSFLFMRAAVPLRNYGSNTSPEVNITNIKLEDPSGNLMVQYKDLSFRGDADYESSMIDKNYATYITEPEINNGALYEWENGFPVYEDNNGYKLSFDVEVLCLDDPFDKGFNVGYEEFVCSTDHLVPVTDGPNDYLALDGTPLSTQTQSVFSPTYNLRISAIEICNSGYPRQPLDFAPFVEHYVPFSTQVQTEGQKIIKHIFPTRVMPHNFDTDIYPSVDTTWQSDSAYPDSVVISNLTQNIASGLYLGKQVSNRSLSTWINLHDSTIVDSGKLIVKFEDKRQTTTRFYQDRDFASGPFNISFDRSRYISTNIDDAYYADISKVDLVVKARKAPSSRDYALDVVGYSDDKILFVTDHEGGFLQNIEGGLLVNQNVLSSSIIPTDELGLSSEALSDKSDTVEYSYSIANSGGDHYILTQTPVINSTLFKEYRIPLKIYELESELGPNKKFNSSPYFEHLYLDIYPIPSGAEISDIKLEVHYSPQNAIHLHTFGAPRDQELFHSNMPLNIIPHEENLDIGFNHNINNSQIPNAYNLFDDNNFLFAENLSRRWRGMSGKNFRHDFNLGFGFSFFKDFNETPFPSGHYNFLDYNSDVVFDSRGENLSGVFVGLSESDIYRNLGWRFNSNKIYENQSLGHRSINWHKFGFHPNYYKIKDAFDAAIRVSGVDKHLSFNNTNSSPLGDFSAFVRFSPDEIIDSQNNLFNDSVIVSKYNAGNDLEFAIGYSDGQLCGYSSDNLGNIIKVVDSGNLSPVFWSFPLSVLLTYDSSDNRLRLYADNERQLPSDFDTNILRGVSEPFTKIVTDQNVTVGYSSGSGVGFTGFITELGFSDRVISSTDQIIDNNTFGGVEDLFASMRMIDARSHKDKLWSYIDSDISNNWKLGSFKNCHFNNDFERLSYRNDKDFIEHHLIHDGLPYSFRTDIDMPATLNASGLAYHTQIENDFLRFNIEDVPEISGKFYVAAPRINKNLPRGYNFSEKAVSVDSVIEHITDDRIVWDDGKVGPKLIVSLYAPSLVPSYEGADKSLGLINRDIHYLAPSGCITKISSLFNKDSLLDESEPWSVFNTSKEHIIKEFDHKYYSSDINDMFLQYDVVYPSGTAFDSRIRIHAAEIRLKDCLRYLPSIDEELWLSTSGDFSALSDINLSIIGHEDVSVGVPSGLVLFVDGYFPEVASGEMNLIGSGGLWPSGNMNLYTLGHKAIEIGGFGEYQNDELFGADGDFGFFLSTIGGGETELLNLNLYNNEFIPPNEEILKLTAFSSTRKKKDIENSLNFRLDVANFIDSGRLSSSAMNLMLYKSDVFSATAKTFNLTNFYEPIPPNSEQSSLNLYTINYQAFDISYTQQQVIQWNGENIGSSVVVTDDKYLSVNSNDEIRGVVTICYGDCDITGLCTNPDINTHGIDWSSDDCHTGGVIRAKDTYTNISFGYEKNYYGARKYGDLIPSYPYVVNVLGYAGSNQETELPRVIETVEYGSNSEVNFSGIKLFNEDPFALHAKYGKDIVTKGDLLAIGAPEYTLYEGEKRLDKSGAVFLYRRLPAPSGYDWSDQDDKSGWSLEEILTLPSGFHRDYFNLTFQKVQDVTSPVRQWEIGNYGRNFGHAVDIAVDEKSGKEMVIVGGPKGIFDRTFEQITTSPIKIAIIVVTDEFAGFDINNVSSSQILSSIIRSRNDYFALYSSPAFQVDVDVIILEPNKNVPFHEFKEFTNASNFIHRYEITRLLRDEDLSVASSRIEQEVRDIFNEIYPLIPSARNNNLPAFIGIMVDESASCGRRIVPGLDDFLDSYPEYSYNNGLMSWENVPSSGVVLDVDFERNSQEDWISFAISAVDYSLSSDNIDSNLDLFASGFGLFYGQDDYRFNTLPGSGGRAYLFERQPHTSGLLHSSDGYGWYITQQFRLDLDNNFDSYYPNEGFGFSVAISDNMENIAIGSPYSESRGATVYELSRTNDLFMLSSKILDWLTHKAEEELLLEGNAISIYTLLYRQFQEFKEQGFNDAGAASKVYDLLTAKYRFEFLNYVSINSPKFDKYKETFSYHNNYNFYGTYDFYPRKFAGHPRVGYSIDLNEDGTILAIGCPTDSMNQWDDTNVWYRNRKECDEEKNALGQPTFGGYQSPYDSESHLQTNMIRSAGHQGTWSSYVNAGAVQVFSGRKYYPHNKVVEYGIFGNAHELYHAPEAVANDIRTSEFNTVSGIFSGMGIPFVKTSFVDPEIPDDAGLLFILSPSQDSLSDEVLDNLKNWLSYGDRNLVLVSDDPLFEADGVYEETNRVVNKILDKLDSRMRVYPAKNTYYAQVNPVLDNNVIPCRIPAGSIEHQVSTQSLFASGVADIRLYDPTMKTHHHGCDGDDFDELSLQAQTLLTAEELDKLNQAGGLFRYTYDTANIGCEQPIKHEGDLRAQWYAWCTDEKQNYHRVPRNIPAAYGLIPGMTEPLCDAGEPCYKDPDKCKWSSKNHEVPPVPLMSIAEESPSFTTIIPGTEDQIFTTLTLIGQEPDPTKNTLKLSTSLADSVFNWDAVAGSTEYSGNYIEEPTLNYGNQLWTEGGQFFKPEDTDKAFILQGKNSKFVEDVIENVLASEFTNIVAEEKFSEENTSSIILMSCVLSESQEVLFTGDDDAILFYRNLLTKNSQEFDSDTIDFAADDINVAQLGGWTNRSSFVDGYHDSFIYKKNSAGSEDGLVATNSLFYHIKNIDLNITSDELLNGRAGKSYSNYDVCWIANTKYLPSDTELEQLKTWLRKGNKKLIITYAHDSELSEINEKIPSQIVADQTSKLCEKLGLSMKPLYLDSLGRYAELGRDSYTKSGDENKKLLEPDFNQSTYHSFITNSERLKQFKFYANDKPQVFSSQNFLTFKETITIPIELNGATRIASIIGEFFPPQSNNSIRNIKRTNINYHYNNSGFAKVSFELPTKDSGYFIKTGWYVQGPIESNSTISIYATNLNSTYEGQIDPTNGEIIQPRKINVSGRTSIHSADQIIVSEQIGVEASKDVIGAYTEINLGPFYAWSNKTDIYITSNNHTLSPLNATDSLPYTAKMAFASGYAVPIIELKGFKDVWEEVEVVIPGTPDQEITIQPPARELGSNHYKYCPDQNANGCLNDFDVPLNQRGGLEQSEWEAQYLSGDDIQTIDGPVVVAQEIEIFSPFIAGFKRSRITVISDASMLQGSGILDENGVYSPELSDFLSSLYPTTDFSSVLNNGKVYSLRNKIVSPERGSPYKWYSAKGDSELISRFNPHNNIIDRLSMGSFVGNESEYDPVYVHRPLYVWECENAPEIKDTEELKRQMIRDFAGTLDENFSSQFSGIIDGVAYGDDLSLYKEKGYDFLDFEQFPEGYPGDLFGYSVKLKGNRLFVGAPFSAYSQESEIVKWDQISNTVQYETPSGVTLSAFGGAGAVYLFENNNKGISPIRGQDAAWQYIRKFRPDSINVGQDYTDVNVCNRPEELGTNEYDLFNDLPQSKFTDRFGFDIDVADGILAIGAPGHDFQNFVEEDSRLGLFMNKAFGRAFDYRTRTVYDLGTSGVRHELPNSGIAILNNGAVYLYSEDYDFATKQNYWHMLEKISPQGFNSHKQKTYDFVDLELISTSGSENSNFGESVSVARRRRTDADYTVAIGSKNHPFTDEDIYKPDHGAGYTYDLMLRRPQPATRSSEAYISGRLFGHSGVKDNEILFNISNTEDDTQDNTASGIIFTNPRGEIFIEVSGQDPSEYGFIQHRPFIKSVDGVILAGKIHTNALRLAVEGRPDEASGIMNLYSNAADSANVYNNLGLYNFGVDGIVQESGLNLVLELESAPIESSGQLWLFASGIGQSVGEMNLRTRGY